MFGFKSKEKKKEETKVTELSKQEKSLLKDQIHDLQLQITSAKSDSKPDLYDKLGTDFQKLDDIDNAIEAFEKSLQIKERYGSAYNALLSLYDQKRKQAAENKNDEDIQKWISKTDDLLAMSKRVMRSSMI